MAPCSLLALVLHPLLSLTACREAPTTDQSPAPAPGRPTRQPEEQSAWHARRALELSSEDGARALQHARFVEDTATRDLVLLALARRLPDTPCRMISDPRLHAACRRDIDRPHLRTERLPSPLPDRSVATPEQALEALHDASTMADCVALPSALLRSECIVDLAEAVPSPGTPAGVDSPCLMLDDAPARAECSFRLAEGHAATDLAGSLARCRDAGPLASRCATHAVRRAVVASVLSEPEPQGLFTAVHRLEASVAPMADPALEPQLWADSARTLAIGLQLDGRSVAEEALPPGWRGDLVRDLAPTTPDGSPPARQWSPAARERLLSSLAHGLPEPWVTEGDGQPGADLPPGLMGGAPCLARHLRPLLMDAWRASQSTEDGVDRALPLLTHEDLAVRSGAWFLIAANLERGAGEDRGTPPHLLAALDEAAAAELDAGIRMEASRVLHGLRTGRPEGPPRAGPSVCG